MASGVLGKAALAADIDTSVYTVPAGKVATVNVNMVNRGSDPVTVRLSIGAAVPMAADYIEYEVALPANGVLERAGMVMASAEVLVARASADTVSVRAYGFEEVA
ncbi:MAG: hypothetical protein AB7F61_14395 [Desulfobulbus sp.]